MSSLEKVDIYQILDMFNKAVGYKGLDNTGKTTEERDDVINRQTFNNWLREYNSDNPRPIKSKKIDQYRNEWFKSDIEKLIQDYRVQKNLKAAYKRKTVEVFKNLRVSKRYKQVRDEMHGQALSESLEVVLNQLIEKIIEDHITVICGSEKINGTNYINKEKVIEDFIDKNKLEEEAFKEIENYYGIPEYDEKGDIIAVHHSQKRPSTDYFLKICKIDKEPLST